jgi:hypothetical protein
MRLSSGFVAVGLLALSVASTLSGCKSCSKKKAAPDAVAAAPVVDAGPPDPGTKLSKAPPPAASTDDDCTKTGTFAAPLLRNMALDQKVPNDQVDAVEKAAVQAYIDACKSDDWPAGINDCVGKNPGDLFTWQRCVNRFPEAARDKFQTAFDAIVVKAGGVAKGGDKTPPPAGGVTFEQLCPAFVAEMTRLDHCASSGMYVPDLENVMIAAHAFAVGGVIPTDKQAELSAMCAKGTDGARSVEAQMCGNAVK